ncbi:MAG: methyltransferase domain-containing protein [Lentisphaerae bacterium]|nr:methyltransferase domain-containing protein [Lentisphaerota bacterium]MCP4100693.1 methyltransferase domain-containing protein [Lentisphaerota bacterium]
MNPKSFWNDIAENYIEFRGDMPLSWWLNGYLTVMQKFSEGTSMEEVKSRNILDFGCGDGLFGLLLASRYNFDVSGIDISEEMIRLAKKNNPAGYYSVFDGQRIEFRSNSFNAVMANWVFPNIDTEQKMFTVLSEIYRVLDDNGTFAFSTFQDKYIGAETSYKRIGEEGKTYSSGDHIKVKLFSQESDTITLNCYYWSEDYFVKILEDVGFQSIEIRKPVYDDITSGKIRELRQEKINIKDDMLPDEPITTSVFIVHKKPI